MPRLVQTAAFFALLGASLLLVGPSPGGAALLAAVLAGGVVAATVAYVLPYVYVELETAPAGSSSDG